MSRTTLLTKPVFSSAKRAEGEVARERNDTQPKSKHTFPSSPGEGFLISNKFAPGNKRDVSNKKEGGCMPLPHTVPYSREGLAALQASLRLHMGLNQSVIWIDPSTQTLTVKQVPGTQKDISQIRD